MSNITQYINIIETVNLENYLNIASIIFLFISLIIIEIAYKKESEKTIVYGLELLVIAIFTLLGKHIPQLIQCTTKTYIITGGSLFIGYYILKAMIIYTIKKKKELNKYSDIKEIVKEEPIKKETKRKNSPKV